MKRNPDFSKIWEWLIKGAITIILEVAVILIANLQGYCTSLHIPCWAYVIIGSIILLFVLLGVVQITWVGIDRGKNSFNSWRTRPDPSNIKVEWKVNHFGEVLLKISNQEWRRPFVKVQPNIKILSKPNIGADEKGYFRDTRTLKWSNSRYSNAITIPKFKYEYIYFGHVDNDFMARELEFYLDQVESSEDVAFVGFPVGKLDFSLELVLTFESNQINRIPITVVFNKEHKITIEGIPEVKG